MVMQADREALKGLTAALLNLDPDGIESPEIINPTDPCSAPAVWFPARKWERFIRIFSRSFTSAFRITRYFRMRRLFLSRQNRVLDKNGKEYGIIYTIYNEQANDYESCKSGLELCFSSCELL